MCTNNVRATILCKSWKRIKPLISLLLRTLEACLITEARKRGRGNIEIQAVCIYSLQDHSQMFNLSLDLNQHLDPCCLQFSEETFKNSPFSYNMLCQSHRRNSGGDVWVSQTSLPQHSFSVFCSVYVDVKAVLIYMLWIYCPVITFKDGLGKSAQFTGGRIMARRATRGH